MKTFYKDQGIHPQKYTGHHGTGKNGGWSRAGKVRYNMIYDKVLKDRTPEKSTAFNNCFIMHFSEDEANHRKVDNWEGGGRAATDQDALPGTWNWSKING